MSSNRPLIPLLYHPTNVVILDDQPEFLNFMRQRIGRHVPYIASSDPDRILNHLRSHTYQRETLSQLILERDFSTVDKPPHTEAFHLNMNRLRNQLDKPEPYKKVAVAFIDRQMPKRDGLELCQEIRQEGLLVNLVLLTGETTSEEVVNAFNKGEIDLYLPKKDLTDDRLNTCITESAWKFFINLSNTLTGLLAHELKPLYDEQFFEVFEAIRNKHQNHEFYLLDSSGSFLLINDGGEVKQLFVRNESDFEDCLEMAKNSEAPFDVRESLKGHQQFPYTQSSMGYLKLKGDAWEDVMVQMDKVPGREFYYTIIDRPDVKPFSFNKYFYEVWPEP